MIKFTLIYKTKRCVMRKIMVSVFSLFLILSPVFAQEYVGKIVRSKDSVFINGKFYDKNKSVKNIAIGDEVKICCGGTLIVHFEKNAKIDELLNTPKIYKFKVAPPDPKLKNIITRYVAYTTLSAASRGGIFEPPLTPPNGAFTFIDEPVNFKWNKPGDTFYLLDNQKKVIFKKELKNSTEFSFSPSVDVKIKEGKYFWKIDNSDNVEINFVK